jgi:protein-tyrosine phosphatase
MAEVLAPAVGDRMGIDVSARSAGILGIQDAPADPRAVGVCRELGLDLSDHHSQPVSEALLQWADRVLVMELEQATHIRRYYTDIGDRLLPLGPFGGYGDIPDPRGGWNWRFRRSRNQIQACLEGFFRRM